MSNFADYLLENPARPDKEFILGTKESINYGELIKRVNSLAYYIFKNYGSGNEFLLLSENSIFFIVSYLSIIKSGNIAVLVETRISKEDLATIISLCDFSGYFVQSKSWSKFNINNHNINENSLKLINKIEGNFSIERNSQDAAVIIFTSGSTGTKKGVVLSNINLISNTESIIHYLNLTEKDRMDVVLPFFYCYGASLLHTHLRVGGSLILSNRIFLGSVINEIKKYECTGFAGVPSTFQILINKTDFLKQDFPSLRYLTQAGGSLPNKYIKMVEESFPNAKFFIMYGATEATARLSYLPPDLLKEKLGSIGKGIPGVSLEIVDDDGNLIKPGDLGEITAFGPNIMKGYYRDLYETNKVIKNGRLFTGDLATIDSEGYIYILGRTKNIIKSAGYRISPNEIENLIISLNDVLDCVTIGIPDDIMGEAVIAVVKPVEVNLNFLKDEITRICKQNLPSYKIPKNILFMREFPLNASNKIDRNVMRKKVMNYYELNNRDSFYE